MPNKPKTRNTPPGATVTSIYASINLDDLAIVDEIASHASPRPISRSLQIATIINAWAQSVREKRQGEKKA